VSLTLFPLRYTFGPEGCARKPTQGYPGDAGWDLYCSRTQVVLPGVATELHTDLHIELPEGFFARIVTRSSTFRRHGLIVMEGIIDNGWRGEMCIQAWTPGPLPASIHTGERVAQLIVHRIHSMEWINKPQLSGSVRGTRGFGSTN